MIKAQSTDWSVRETIQRNTDNLVTREIAPRIDWSHMSESDHIVQFYETDTFLLQSLAAFITTGLHAGEAAIVVATRPHREGLEQLLQESGVDIATLRASGQYTVLDAAETLSTFMLSNLPNPRRFTTVIGGIIGQARQSHSRVRIFGEMVALLWDEGNYDGAIRLEELWNHLHKDHAFSLLCAYPMHSFDGETLDKPLSHICAEHAHVIPAESYSTLANPHARLHAILLLQQKARLLEAEIVERKQAEATLHIVKDELEVQIEDLRRLHEMSARLASTLDIESVLQEVLRAALAVHNTTFGLLSLCDSEQDRLVLKASSGFDETFLSHVATILPGEGACGTSYEQQRRIVVEDIETDAIFTPHRAAAQKAGIRACHSTPLITRSDNMIGVISVHFCKPYRPSERETRLMDLYARMAADSIENARLHHSMQQELEERKQLLIREHMARAEAESANRMKDEFLATVSHELRTPLTPIIAWAQRLLRNRRDEATVVRGLEIIERSAKTQAQLIEDILDVSRVITGNLRLTIEPVDLASVINTAIDSVQLAADTKGIHLEVILNPSARHVMGDAGRLQQVVWNLLSNAIKFTPADGRVEVRLERVGSNVQLSVSDTGEGISPDFLPFVFDRFRQADSTNTRRHGGLGLGLAIVRHLVEIHGGTAHAESAGEGCGATFIIFLPLAPVDGRANNQSSNAQSALLSQATSVQDTHIPVLNGVQVLLVDDSPDTLQILTAMLVEYQAKVQVAASAAEALDLLHWYQPDVLVFDLAMPDEDGYSLMSKVRMLESKTGKYTPAIALTASVRSEDRVRALSAGFNLFVPKPVETSEFIIAIANLVKTSQIGSMLA